MSHPYTYKATVKRVVDGDALVVDVDLGFRMTSTPSTGHTQDFHTHQQNMTLTPVWEENFMSIDNLMIEKVCRRLLREVTQPVVNPFSYDDIGFIHKMSSAKGVGVAYHPKMMVDSLIDASGEYVKPIDFYARDFCKSSVFAYIEIRKPKDPCNGAWEVKASAARHKGEGKLAYAMGYHMSPTGLLMPDRKGLSPYARDVWRKVRKKSAGKTLDNIRHPQKHVSDGFNSDPFHDMYHTEEKSDDCETWSVSYSVLDGDFASQRHGVEDEETQDAVNRAYYAMEDMRYDFKSMKRIHAESTRFIIDNFNFAVKLDENAIEKALIHGGSSFFSDVMR